MQRLLIIFLLGISSSFAQTDTLTIVSYNLLNFPDGRDDCGTNTVVPNRSDTLRKILAYEKPDIFVACEIQTEAGADSVLTRSLNVYGASNYASAAYHDNSTGGDLQNQLFYNTDKLILKSQDYIVTGIRDIDHYILYANDPNLGVYYDTTFIEVYMCHLKAGSGSSEQSTRAQQTQLLMDFIATRPTDRHHIVCGDLNVYTSNEQGYSQLVSGPFGLVDPINSPGSWNNNGSFSSIHTQSTRTSLNLDCGSKGGLDDRFDQILISQNMISGEDSIKYLNNSYKTLGNDGNHFNSNLISGTNTSYPDSLVNALYYMSDHLPVSLKAVITYPTSNGLALYPLIQPVSCSGGSDGEATIVPNDGQAPYSYQWDAAAGSQTTATATGLSQGSYCVQVTDALNEVDDYCLYVNAPQALSFSTFMNPDTGGCNGEGYLLLSGGVAPYTVTWNDVANQTGQSALNLCSGNYEATVVDANGCVTIVPLSIQYVGLEEFELVEFSIYPNPASQSLTVEINNTFSEMRYKIMDVSGRTIGTGKLMSQIQQMDISNFSAGSYYLILINSENSFSDQKMFIKK